MESNENKADWQRFFGFVFGEKPKNAESEANTQPAAAKEQPKTECCTKDVV